MLSFSANINSKRGVQEMKKKAGLSMRSKMRMILIVLVVAIAIAPIISLINIMFIQGQRFQKMASDQQLYDVTLSAPRGEIYDCNNNILATSSPAWTVYILPNVISDIKDKQERETVKNLIADNLSQILEIEREKIYGYTEKTNYYISIKSRANESEANEVREFIAANKKYDMSTILGLDETTKRYYPNDSLASVVLGFVGTDNQGLSGLESRYNTELTGIPGRVVAAKNAIGLNMPLSYENTISAQPGNSLVLTIDSYIQYVAEKYLEEAVIANKVSQRGAAIVMDVNTGAIRGLAVKGDFDPNDPFTLSASDQEIVDALEGDERKTKLAELRNKQWRNKVISDTYEPGSVFKVVTLSAALEEGICNLNNSYTCTGSINVAGQRYSCHKKIGHGTQSLLQGLCNSCNPVFITLGTQLGASTFSKYFSAFGLTKTTGIDLPGEASSVYHAEEKMGATELASTSFGQTFKITPIQLITAVSAAVNGGKLVQPYVVSQIKNAEGEVLKTTQTNVKLQVISEQTSKQVCSMMEKVVSEGGGKNAYVAGYQICGKTGTSQKVAEMLSTGTSGLYVASFCGVAPANDPEIAVLVLLDEPHGSAYYGGTISAPVAGQIFSDILPYLGYEPQYTESELASLAIPVPSVTGKTVAEAKTTLNSENLTYKVIGDGEKVIKQLPESSKSIKSGGLVVLYTTEDAEVTKANVPSFTHMTVSQVNAAASAANVNVEFSGNIKGAGTKAYKQSVAAGTAVDQGTVITVYFRDDDTGDFAR